MANALADFWNMVRGWATQNASQYIAEPIPHDRTDLTGPDTPLVPLRDYLRLWLDDMFLSSSRNWFIDLYPAVHTAIELKFGADPIKISHVTDGSPQVGRGSYGSYALTDLIPFNGGIVTLQSALVALQGTNYASAAINILKEFSGLVAAPLGQSLAIAEKVSAGLQNTFQKGNGGVVLGFQRQFAADGGGGGTVLKPGYFAVVLATRSQIDPEGLSVKNSRLHYARPGKTPEPLEGFDYMLFRIEGRQERDNWRMANIEEPLNQAIQATLRGQEETAKGCLTSALLVIWQSPDLAVKDRRRVADAIKAELAEVSDNPHQAVAGELPTLDSIMKKHAGKPSARAHEPELTLAEILG
jgi:hypothetical protein